MNYRPLPAWYTHGHLYLFEQFQREQQRDFARRMKEITDAAVAAIIEKDPPDHCGYELRPYRSLTTKEKQP